ncbi:hypothetical protein MRX96_018911 [Rhipicephalus microplus]
MSLRSGKDTSQAFVDKSGMAKFTLPLRKRLARYGIVRTRAQVHTKIENLRSKYRLFSKKKKNYRFWCGHMAILLANTPVPWESASK